MSSLIKLYSQNIFQPIIFDANKYKDHTQAFLNNDFQIIVTNHNSSEYLNAFSFYQANEDTLNSVNKLNNSNLKLAVPVFEIDTYQHNLLELCKDTLGFDPEFHILIDFVSYLLSSGKNITISNNNSTEIFNEFEFIELFSTFKEISELMKLDFLGKVSIHGKSIAFLFNTIVINQTHNINTIFDAINFDNF
jgi:hypothetical protein